MISAKSVGCIAMSFSKSFTSSLLALAATIAAWASVPLVLKYFATHTRLDGWTVNGLRYLFTSIFWLPFVVRMAKGDPAACKGVVRAAWVPALLHMVGQASWGLAPYFNDASVMNFVSRISFLLTLVAGFWLLREERALSRSPLFWIGVAGSIVGLLAMFEGGLHTGNTSLPGMLLILGASTCWAFYAVFVRKRMQDYPARLGFGVVSLLVVPGLTALMFTFGDWRAAQDLTVQQWILLAVSGWIGISMGHVLYYHAVRTLGPIVSEGSLAMIPFVTAMLGGMLLGEHLLPSQWTGGTLLVAASLCLLAAKRGKAQSTVVEDPAGG